MPEHSLGPAVCGPHGDVQQDDAISEISHIVQGQLNAVKWKGDTDQTYHYPFFTFWHHKAVHSHCTIMCRGLWFSGLGSSLSNPLQKKCTDLYINGTSVRCLC